MGNDAADRIPFIDINTHPAEPADQPAARSDHVDEGPVQRRFPERTIG